MISKQLALTDEQTSPLFRIMWAYNHDQPIQRKYENNICAFHIGDGFILTVAHNLKSEALLFKSINNDIFTSEIVPHLNPEQLHFLLRCYILQEQTNMRHINTNDQADITKIVELLRQINFDTRWLTFAQKEICKPFLILQFRNNQFYNNSDLTKHFNTSNSFAEPPINRYTFLVEVELLDAFYQEDIALYKMVNTHQDVIRAIPKIEPDFSILPDGQKRFYGLQSSPGGFLGRLLNKAHIEGHLDHHGMFVDRFGGNYTFEGLRYLIQGYFRFGSSGAPYVFFDPETKQFKVNAIQSEASPIQLSINNNKEGNFQYINAIASPLHLIEEKLRSHVSNKV